MTSEQAFEVGDIVFCVKSKNAVVIAAQIVEVNTKKILGGSVTKTFVAKNPEGQVIDLSQFDAIFPTAEDAYVNVVSRFEAAIRDIVDKAKTSAAAFSAVQN